MTERPILFSAPMVRAILDGTKTQTRRIAKGVAALHAVTGEPLAKLDSAGPRVPCPYGQPGDQLWVRETFQRFSDDGATLYKADPAALEAMNDLKRDGCLEACWRPSIHMPRWASRITLEVTSVRVERLQDISIADAMAEGVVECARHLRNLGPCMEWRYAYEDLWTDINGCDSWNANPWVWVVEFTRTK